MTATLQRLGNNTSYAAEKRPQLFVQLLEYITSQRLTVTIGHTSNTSVIDYTERLGSVNGAASIDLGANEAPPGPALQAAIAQHSAPITQK